MKPLHCFQIDPKLNLPSKDYCCLEIKDTGTGIAPETIKHIFEPYFTTKELGKGSGIGLSVVHGIVKNYKGAITVESELNKGTVFYIYLPLISHTIKSENTMIDIEKKLLLNNEQYPFRFIGHLFC